MEAECIEEQCSPEEHNEIINSDDSIPEDAKTPEFLQTKWENYTSVYLEKCWSDKCSAKGTYLCVNKFKKRDCICHLGWRGDICDEDIDECSESSEPVCSGPNVVCQNSLGSYQCVCEQGYKKMINMSVEMERKLSIS